MDNLCTFYQTVCIYWVFLLAFDKESATYTFLGTWYSLKVYLKSTTAMRCYCDEIFGADFFLATALLPAIIAYEIFICTDSNLAFWKLPFCCVRTLLAFKINCWTTLIITALLGGFVKRFLITWRGWAKLNSVWGKIIVYNKNISAIFSTLSA